MTFSAGARLGIDFGTSHTVAAVALDGRPVQPLLFDATPLLPSGVCAEPGSATPASLGAARPDGPGIGAAVAADRGSGSGSQAGAGGFGSSVVAGGRRGAGASGVGRLLTGRDAEVAGRRDPARFEPNPKRLVDDGAVLLGEWEVPIAEVVAAVLGRVADEAVRVAGRPLGGTVLTHPVTWGARRRGVLLEAAALAGLAGVSLVAEPVAAAVYFTRGLHHVVPVGGAVAVYDLGGGTFDTTVLRRGTGDAWEVLADGGLAETGGLDLDAAIVDWVGARAGLRRPDAWRELLASSGDRQRRLRQALWTDVRIAKEQLSRTSSAVVPVPSLDVEVHLTREEFEQLARPYLARTVELTATTVARAGLRVEDLAGVFLVGGSSRIPLVATLLHQRLGIAPTVIEQPELVVAQGSLLTTEAATGETAWDATGETTGEAAREAAGQAVREAPVTAGFATAPPAAEPARPAPPVPAAAPVLTAPPVLDAAPQRRRVPWLAAVSLVVLLAVGYVLYPIVTGGGGYHGSTGSGSTADAAGAGSATGAQRPLSLDVNRTAWYGGYKITFKHATLDADHRLTVAVQVDNTGTSQGNFSPTVTFTDNGRSVGGTDDISFVEGLVSSSGNIVFDLDRTVTDLRTAKLTVGEGAERRADIPFDPTKKAADLAPVTIPLSGAKSVGNLRYTLHPCDLRTDFPFEHEQAKADSAFLICTVDAQALGQTSFNYGLGEANFRLVLPDASVVAPTKAPNAGIDPQQSLTDQSVVFPVPGGTHGPLTLQLRDPGRLGYDTPTGDHVWSVQVLVP